jgi:hypothetical protein
MKNLCFVLAVLAILCFGVSAQSILAQSIVPFGGDLDRPVSTEDADKQEGDSGADDEPPVPDDPEDDDEELPPEFMDEPLEGHRFVFVLDRSCSMGAGFQPGFPIYDRNGNVISYPSRWQGVQSEVAGAINNFTEDDSFDVISFNSSTYICFGSLMTADGNACGQAMGWIYNQNATGGTRCYDGLRAAFNNYGTLDCVAFLCDGYPGDGNQTLNAADGWIAMQVADNPAFLLMVIQVGGSPIGFMVSLGAKSHAEFHLK